MAKHVPTSSQWSVLHQLLFLFKPHVQVKVLYGSLNSEP